MATIPATPSTATRFCTDSALRWTAIPGTGETPVTTPLASSPAIITSTGSSKSLAEVSDLPNGGSSNSSHYTLDGRADHFAAIELAGK